MSYLLLAILALAIIGSFAAAYKSSQTWPVHQVVVVELIFLASVAFFYLAARTLNTHKYYREQVRAEKDNLARLESQLLPLRGGMSPQGQVVAGEVPELKHRLAMLTRTRGGVYYNVSADSIKDDVVQLTLRPPGEKGPVPTAPGQPAPVEPEPEEPAATQQPAAPFKHGLIPDMVVFAFDAKPISAGGRYLGEFKVVAAPENSPAVQISPFLPLNESQRKNLEAAVGGTWTLYTAMPTDNAKAFAEMDDAARQALLPPESVAEYAQADRKLRDYLLFFHENHVESSLLRDSIAKTTTNIERTQFATNEAAAEAKFREGEKGKLQADLEKFQFEVQAIANYEKSLEQLLTQVHARLKATYIENRRAAMTLTREQFKAQQEIDRRTSAAAQASR
jgi:hypothetical protein